MTLLLASVRDAAEAETAIGAGADIVDLKDPREGALGALAPETIDSCVRAVARRVPVSATIGDLPLEGDAVRSAVLATAARGVDYVKLGVFPGAEAERCFDLLATLATETRLIVVLFADALPQFDAIGIAARTGAAGIMLDTMGKGAGSLPDLISNEQIAAFTSAARAGGLTIGLAGSLKASHVPDLLTLRPDLLGFRGALCHDGKREAPLDPVRLGAIRALIPEARGVEGEANLQDRHQHTLC
jgi:dihydroneopterin aldolase